METQVNAACPNAGQTFQPDRRKKRRKEGFYGTSRCLPSTRKGLDGRKKRKNTKKFDTTR